MTDTEEQDQGRGWAIARPRPILILLVIATALNLMDRQLPFIMAEPIKKEFALDDTQLGLLGGLAFSLVYAFGALPMARIADTRSRRWVLAISLGIWSICTGFAGFSRSFVQLMISRAGVAIGEAAAAPTSHALIADLFPIERRGRAMAIHTAGISIGIILGLGLGGLLLTAFSWRTVLMMAAVPGLVLAIIFGAFVREPARRGAHAGEGLPPIGPAIATLWRQRSFVWLTCGATLSALATSGGASFGPSFFIRVHHLSTADAGLLFGLMMGGGGVLGGVLAGTLSDRLVRTDRRWVLWIPAIGAFADVPLWFGVWSLSSLWSAAIVLLITWVIGSSYLPLSYAATQSIAAPRMRAFSSAAIQLVLNLLGNVTGPLLTGYLSDRLRAAYGVRSLGVSLTVGCAFLLASAFCFLRAAHWHLQDIDDANQLARAADGSWDTILIEEAQP